MPDDQPDLPLIPASTPYTIPATEERVYDKWWLADLRVIGALLPDGTPDPSLPLNGIATLYKGRKREDGTWEMAPNIAANRVILRLDDIIAAAETDPDAANAIVGIMTYLVKLGYSQGVL